MRKVSLLLLALITVIIYDSNAQDTYGFLDEIIKYDISSLFVESKSPDEHKSITIDDYKPLGFFGSNYQRFQIHFISVIKNKNNPLEYFVFGKTKLKETITSFQGTLKITDCGIFKFGEIPEFKQGYVKYEYNFYEDPLNGGSGSFIGTGNCHFFIDTEDRLYYDAITLAADGYNNNQFEGTWISYTSGKKYKCNWGSFRIPDSDELDIGAGEFGVSREYLDRGWKTYEIAKGYGGNYTEEEIKKAREEENEEWWK